MNLARKARIFLNATLLLLFGWQANAVFSAEGLLRRAEWEQALEAGKKEGQVKIYGEPLYETVFLGFAKKHPAIKSRFILGEPRETVPRIVAEIRAGKPIADLYLSGPTLALELLYKNGLLAPFRPSLMLPEVVDESKWFGEKHTYSDPEGHIFAFELSAQNSGVAYNTRAVNPDEIQSYWDLAHPKWRGKIVSPDPMGLPGPILPWLRYIYHNPDLGPQFVKRLYGQTGVSISRDDRQMMNWLSTGKYAFYLGPRGLPQAKRQGLPVEMLPRPIKEKRRALTVGQGTASILKTAPQPNAAKVAVNWLLSREGQLAFQHYSEGGVPGRGSNSAREDIPKDMVDPERRREKGAHYINVSAAEYMDMRPVYKIVSEALAEAKREGY